MKIGATASPWRYVRPDLRKTVPTWPFFSESTTTKVPCACFHATSDVGIDLLSKFLLGPLQIVALLQIEPKVRTVPAQLPEPQCHHWRYRLLFLENVIERLTRDAEQPGDLRLPDFAAGRVTLR